MAETADTIRVGFELPGDIVFFVLSEHYTRLAGAGMILASPAQASSGQ